MKLASSMENVTSSPPHTPNLTTLYLTIGCFAAEAISVAILVCVVRFLQLAGFGVTGKTRRSLGVSHMSYVLFTFFVLFLFLDNTYSAKKSAVTQMTRFAQMRLVVIIWTCCNRID